MLVTTTSAQFAATWLPKQTGKSMRQRLTPRWPANTAKRRWRKDNMKLMRRAASLDLSLASSASRPSSSRTGRNILVIVVARPRNAMYAITISA